MTTEINLGQTPEVLTPAQGYLMFFNNRGVTALSLVLRQPKPLTQSTNSFLLNVRPLFLILLSFFERYLIEVTLSKSANGGVKGDFGH
jgi:hypothetical protein